MAKSPGIAEKPLCPRCDKPNEPGTRRCECGWDLTLSMKPERRPIFGWGCFALIALFAAWYVFMEFFR